ncbi:MAG: altronate dehydratase family protein [Bacteroidota bacterium]
MNQVFLQIHPKDNVLAALQDLPKGRQVDFREQQITLKEDIPAKHKFTTESILAGEDIVMYGVLVGKALHNIEVGCRISLDNTTHAAQTYGQRIKNLEWEKPNVEAWRNRTFMGYHRQDGQVGTMNTWLVIPLVFCENRNVEVIKKAMLEVLGYAPHQSLNVDVHGLMQAYENGATLDDLLAQNVVKTQAEIFKQRFFKNIDGIKFLTHEGGCGGTREDADTLCRLLAGYITHPNVAGATVLSLGCQNAQIQILKDAIQRLNPNFSKPLYFFEQQQSASEAAFIGDIVKQTFVGLIEANRIERRPASIAHLKIGLECGGSDGFSGISANPTLGYTSDMLVALGGTSILAEFPELNGVEQELINRCEQDHDAKRFAHLMQTYSNRAEAVGSGFKNNPSPGNIKDGLITDAIKSAGAAKKGGSSPVRAVLDYTEPARKNGLNLLCTPGNDVESTTGLAGSGANIIIFTTGLGTPTGNPITPVIKVSSNTKLYEKMNDIIDFNTGTIISGEDTPQTKGEELLEFILQVASGKKITKASQLGQDDFIPWKRGISL